MYPGQSGQLRPTRPAWPSTPPAPQSRPSAGGPDGHQLTQPVNGHLDYVSQLSRQLDVIDPVESYLTPVVGRWSDLHAEATRWRTAASTATQVTQSLTKPLGGLDAAWQGPSADSFVDYMQNVGLAGNDLADAMNAMADALDKTADGLRQIVNEMVGVLSDTAAQTSDAMSAPVGGEDRARQFLSEVNQPTSQLYESVRDVLSAFVRMCDGPQGSSMTPAHKMPAQNWTDPTARSTPRSGQPAWPGQPQPGQPQPGQPVQSGQPGQTGQPTQPAQPAPAGPASPSTMAAAASGSGQHAQAAAAHMGGGSLTPPISDTASAAAAQHAAGAGQMSGVSSVSSPDTTSAAHGGGMGAAAEGGGEGGSTGSPMMGGMGGMGGMRGGGQGGGDYEHKSKIRLNTDPKELFGKVDQTAPPVIGED